MQLTTHKLIDSRSSSVSPRSRFQTIAYLRESPEHSALL